ncbi:MAG: LacI family DNA-binding transcriptional regulator [Chloroflexota bacterium]
MANLRDVARRAEVDPSTVSRVLRDDPSQQVRPETRERILAAARDLHYRPNALARGLRTRRTDTLGLIVASLDNLGFAEVTAGIQAAAAAAGKLVMVVDAGAVAGPPAETADLPETPELADGPTDGTAEAAPGPELSRSGDVYERLIGDGRLDGLIVAFAALDDRHVAQLAERGIPLVLVNRRTTGVHGSVVVDDTRGSATAVEHLVRLGHRRIGSIGLAQDTDTARRRDAGYRGAMAAAALPVDERWVQAGPPTVDGGREALYRLLAASKATPPTAIVVASLMSAVGVLAALRDAGRRVPDDVSIVAFNDHPFADHTAPPLTTVRMPNLRMGQEAVRMLLDALDGVPVSDLVVDDAPALVVRGSTAPPRA